MRRLTVIVTLSWQTNVGAQFGHLWHAGKDESILPPLLRPSSVRRHTVIVTLSWPMWVPSSCFYSFAGKDANILPPLLRHVR